VAVILPLRVFAEFAMVIVVKGDLDAQLKAAGKKLVLVDL
jgi:hypothetical protein